MNNKQLVDELKERIAALKFKEGEEEVGSVIANADGITRISGLPETMSQEKLIFKTKSGQEIPGLALNIEETTIGAVILGESQKIVAGDSVSRTKTVLEIPAGREMIGRVVNPLGEPQDEKGAIKTDQLMPLERIAPGVITRETVKEPLQTGIISIDAMVPIGRGQRELIIGDRGTGKTAIALDTIINQKGGNVVCIYVAIGQKESKVRKIVAKLAEMGAMEHTIVVLAGASSPASLQYIAPYAGAAIGEYFMGQGEDVLVIYDDLSKHAWAYREVSLLLRRPPGREAYPGDVFYLHSRLLERAAKLNKENGGGSLTALPIIETQAGDVSAYIPTNVISITDGQIFLESDLFYQGIRPAINPGISVSRVGGTAQLKPMKQVAGKLRLDLAQYRELAAFAQFGSDLDEATKKQLERGKRITEILKQPQFEPMPVEEQIATLFAVTEGLWDLVPVAEIKEKQESFLIKLRGSHKEVLAEIKTAKELSQKTKEVLTKVAKEV